MRDKLCLGGKLFVPVCLGVKFEAISKSGSGGYLGYQFLLGCWGSIDGCGELELEGSSTSDLPISNMVADWITLA